MKEIKKRKTDSTVAGTFEDEIIRMDLEIEGYEMVKGIPIELGGVRSFILEETPVEEIKTTNPHQPPTPKATPTTQPKLPPMAVLSQV